MTDVVEKVLEHGIVTAIAIALLYWILKVQTTSMNSGFRAMRLEVAMQTAANLSVASTMQGFQSMFLIHHATVFGINPSVGENDQERESLALKQFEEIKTLLASQKEQTDKTTRLVERYLERLITEEQSDSTIELLKHLKS